MNTWAFRDLLNPNYSRKRKKLVLKYVLIPNMQDESTTETDLLWAGVREWEWRMS